jgi:hypothetical protein
MLRAIHCYFKIEVQQDDHRLYRNSTSVFKISSLNVGMKSKGF